VLVFFGKQQKYYTAKVTCMRMGGKGIKMKLSLNRPWRPIGLWDVEALHIF
jgi:hypothetical protein